MGVVAACLAVLVQTAAQLVNQGWNLHKAQLNADVEGNALTWLSAGAVMACALSVVVLAAQRPSSRVRLGLLAVVLAVFALDDTIEIHEKVSGKATAFLGIDAEYLRALWPVMYLPLLAFAFFALWRLSEKTEHGGVRRALRCGLAALFVAVVLEVLWTLYHVGPGARGDWPDTIEVAIEEGLELGGWLLLAAGLAAEAVVGPPRFRPGPPDPRRVETTLAPASRKPRAPSIDSPAAEQEPEDASPCGVAEIRSNSRFTAGLQGTRIDTW